MPTWFCRHGQPGSEAAKLADPALLKRVEADKLEGLKLRVKGTPTIFINGKQYHGEKNEAELADRIDEELDLVAGRIK